MKSKVATLAALPVAVFILAVQPAHAGQKDYNKKDYSVMSCEELAAELDRIDALEEKMRLGRSLAGFAGLRKAGTISGKNARKLSQMRRAVHDARTLAGC